MSDFAWTLKCKTCGVMYAPIECGTLDAEVCYACNPDPEYRARNGAMIAELRARRDERTRGRLSDDVCDILFDRKGDK